jgi:rhodanese-related sulfurtransferase
MSYSHNLELSPQRVAELFQNRIIQVVDVREPYEYEAGHIEGAIHIPLEQLTARPEGIDASRCVAFYCRVGARSLLAAHGLRAAGYCAHNMAGGLVAWHSSGLSLSPTDGYVAMH